MLREPIIFDDSVFCVQKVYTWMLWGARFSADDYDDDNVVDNHRWPSNRKLDGTYRRHIRSDKRVWAFGWMANVSDAVQK